MQLRQIIDGIPRESDSLCIVAKRPWRADSDGKLVQLTHDYRVPNEVLAQGYEYFLEVSVALDEVLNDLDNMLSPDQRFDAVLYYAEHDAYPEWLYAVRERAGSGDA